MVKIVPYMCTCAACQVPEVQVHRTFALRGVQVAIGMGMYPFASRGLDVAYFMPNRFTLHVAIGCAKGRS